MTDDSHTPAEPREPAASAAAQHPGKGDTPENGSAAVSGEPHGPDKRVAHRPTVVARNGKQVTLRNGKTITLEPTMIGPSGDPVPRCQGIANRYDIDPNGGAAKQCGRPAIRGETVCDRHGGRAAQRRRLEGLVPAAIDTYERVMDGAEKDADALRAADSVLDRTGYARQSDVRIDPVQQRADIEARLAEVEAADTTEPVPEGDATEDDPPETPAGKPVMGETSTEEA